VDSLGIRLVGNEWVREWTLLRTTRRKRGPLVIWTNTSGETSAGTLQTRETIEQPCSDVLAHTPEVCKGTHLYNGYPAIKDHRDSWGTSTTSVECKTVITVVLTVMSDMDPHMISGNIGMGTGYVLVGLCRSGFYWVEIRSR
jgi:hypothetical protein